MDLGVPRRRPAAAALAVVALMVSACGARLTADQRALALRGGGTAAVGATPGAGPAVIGSQHAGRSGGVQPGAVAPGTGPVTAGGGPTAGPGTGPGSGTARGPGGHQAPQAAGQACSATAKNNGGSTDKGVTATSIRVGNISDISGPVPGLFKSAEQAAYAFVAYFNSQNPNGVCGRKLTYDPRDSATDSGTDRTQTLGACQSDFAIVGSMSAFDDGGAQPVKSCHIVDMPAIAVTTARQETSITYAANGASTHHITAAVPDYFNKHAGSATKHAAFLYIDAGASTENAKVDIEAYKKDGWHFDYIAGVPVQNASTQGFKPYVQKMKDSHVQLVEWIGAYQEAASLAQAMSQSSYKPAVFLLDPTGYNPQYLQLAGSSAEGTWLYDDAVPLSEVGKNPELTLYSQWLQRTGVSDPPTYFGQYAWSAMRLFTEMLFKVGPKLTRAAVDAEVRKVHSWTDNGMHAPMDVGRKLAKGCNQIYQVRQGKFAAASSGYTCGRLITP